MPRIHIAFFIAFCAAGASAQEAYPAKPLTMVVLPVMLVIAVTREYGRREGETGGGEEQFLQHGNLLLMMVAISRASAPAVNLESATAVTAC